MRSSTWLCLAVLVLFAPLVFAAAPPARLSEKQRQKLAEAERLFVRANQAFGKGLRVEAVALARRGLARERAVFGEVRGIRIDWLAWLGRTLGELGEHREAVATTEEVLRLRLRWHGAGHWRVVDANWEARDARMHARLTAAQRQKLRQAGQWNREAVQSHRQGKSVQGLRPAQQALKLRKEILGEKHPLYATSLNNLALLYHSMGDRKGALPLYQQALSLRRQMLGEKHPGCATCLNNLALLYMAMGDHKAALPLFQQALKLHKEILGEKHPDYARSLNNLAWIYQVMGDHKGALPLYQQALKLRKEIRGERRLDYAQSLRGLAVLYQVMGDHTKALPLFQQALALNKEILGEKHPEYAANLYNLAVLYQTMGDNWRALWLMRMSLALTRERLDLVSAVQSERQQLAAAEILRYRLDFYLSISSKGEQSSSHRDVLAWKGAVLAAQRSRRLLLSSSDSGVRKSLQELEALTRELAVLSLSTPRPQLADQRRRRLEELTLRKEELEVSLSKRSAEFRRHKQPPDSPELSKHLPADAVLIDFLFSWHFTPSARPGEQWERRLAAFVLRKGMPVVRLDLGPAKAIEKAVEQWRLLKGKQRVGVLDPGLVLRRLLWLPLEKHVKGAKVVLLSPDGALAKLPFAALPGSKPDTFLLEEVALAVVPVPQLLPGMLAPVDKKARLAPSLLAVGDVNFDSAEVVVARVEDRAAPRGSLKGWGMLPGTAAEVASVGQSFGDLFRKGRLTSLRKEDATKKAVREALSRHRYAHLATHGFFAPAELKSALAGDSKGRGENLFGRSGVSGWHPLLLSGIVLAGANREAKPGEEDGILTALEVSELDLRKLELVVLSACETGLGQEAGGEGLLGLQRAFQVAGARSVIASLWKVDDRATQQLMSAFYQSYWDRKKIVSRVEALRQAQLLLLREGVKRGFVPRAKLAEKGTRLPPEYWAAFVLSGDWR